jgi:long-chain-fatty-acid--CoA ligase ACSBG
LNWELLSPAQAGGIGCGIYTTNNPEACHYVADNCSANIIFAENKVQIAKILQVSDVVP